MKRFILFILLFTLQTVFSAEQAPLRFDPESETLVNMYCKAVLKGHAGCVKSVAFSPHNNNILASAIKWT
jgi:hypothetical protein